MGKTAKKDRTPAQLANDQRLRDMAASRKGSAATNVRQTRAQDERQAAPGRKGEAEDTPWVQGGSLHVPFPPRPGYRHRWIRSSIKSKDDAKNMSKSLREGWHPRSADTVPPSYQMARIEHGRFGGIIMVEGMVLCEMPVAKLNQRKQFIRNETDKKVKAIDADLKRANEANRGPGFGDIKVDERITKKVREVRVQQEEAEVD